MTIDLEHIRCRNPIEDVVAEKFALRKAGSRYVGVEHDSLVIVRNSGFYFWNSRDEHGDVFDFAGRYLMGYEQRWSPHDVEMFLEVVDYLAWYR